MANRKATRRTRRRSKRSNVASQLVRIRSGIPRSIKLRNTNPPMIPSTFQTTMRVRFNVVYGGLPPNDQTSEEIVAGSLQSGQGTIFVYFRRGSAGRLGTYTRSYAVRSQYFADLVFNRMVGGFRADLPAGLDNRAEYSLDTVSFYGPISNETSGITRVSIDWGEGLPGVNLNDQPDKLKRAAVCASPSRLIWRRYLRSLQPNDGFMTINYNIPAIVPDRVEASNANTINYLRREQIGVLDAVVHIRVSNTENSSDPNTLVAAEMVKSADAKDKQLKEMDF